MRVLVIGCGYLGLRVAKLLLAQSEEVYATTRKVGRLGELSALGLRPILCDVLAPEPLPDVEAVIHDVGFDRSSGAGMRQVYVGGMGNVLAALPGRPRFVHVSSTSVYGQRDGGIVDEDAAIEPADEAGRVVLEAERLLRDQRPDAIVLRFAGIYGPGRLMRSAELLAGEPIAADPATWLNLIHVEDGAEAVVAAAARGEPGMTYNVSDGSPVRRGDFYVRLAVLLGAPPPRFVLPAGSGHESADRRVANGRMCGGLGVRVRYPTYELGLEASVAKE